MVVVRPGEMTADLIKERMKRCRKIKKFKIHPAEQREQLPVCQDPPNGFASRKNGASTFVFALNHNSESKNNKKIIKNVLKSSEVVRFLYLAQRTEDAKVIAN